jgi:glycosyltransferase involved in cell wall biosynthesis
MNGSHPEVIVVDNSFGDQQTEQLAIKSGVRYVIEPRVGLSNARNAGAAAATGELIAFIDDDALADSVWLARHSAVLADDSLIASTGRILPIGTEHGPGWEAMRALDLGDQAFVVDHRTPDWFERANFGGLGSGANMVIKRRAFADGWRFREILGLGADLGGFEEYYLFFKLIGSGARIAYVPDAVVRHGPDSSGEPRAQRIASAHLRSAAYLTMLLVEEPEYRRQLARYVAQMLRGHRLPWRPEEPPSRLKLLAAGCRGPFFYLRNRLAGR